MMVTPLIYVVLGLSYQIHWLVIKGSHFVTTYKTMWLCMWGCKGADVVALPLAYLKCRKVDQLQRLYLWPASKTERLFTSLRPDLSSPRSRHIHRRRIEKPAALHGKFYSWHWLADGNFSSFLIDHEAQPPSHVLSSQTTYSCDYDRSETRVAISSTAVCPSGLSCA